MPDNVPYYLQPEVPSEPIYEPTDEILEEQLSVFTRYADKYQKTHDSIPTYNIPKEEQLELVQALNGTISILTTRSQEYTQLTYKQPLYQNNRKGKIERIIDKILGTSIGRRTLKEQEYADNNKYRIAIEYTHSTIEQLIIKGIIQPELFRTYVNSIRGFDAKGKEMIK